MRASGLLTRTAICLALPSMALAQTAGGPTIDDLQKQATYAGTLAANQKTLSDSDLSILTAIQAGGAGAGGGADYDKTAEAVLFGHYALAGAAQKMATYLARYDVSKQPILVVSGALAPITGNLIEFERSRDLVDGGLEAAIADWESAQKSPTPRVVKRVIVKKHAAPAHQAARSWTRDSPAPSAGATEVITGLAATGNPIGLALAAAATVASLGRVDTTINGAAVAPDADQSRAIITTALVAAGLPVDMSEFDLATDPSDADLGMTHYRADYEKAYGYYHRDYMTALSKAGGKTDGLPANVSAAGANLAAALLAATTFEQNLIKSVNGVSPLSVIYAQAVLQNQRASHQILYVRSVHTAVTVRNNKGFFVGITRSPSDFEGASSIDCLMVTPSSIHSAQGGPAGFSATPISAVFYTGTVRLWRVEDFIRDNALTNPPPVLPCLASTDVHKKKQKTEPARCVSPAPAA